MSSTVGEEDLDEKASPEAARARAEAAIAKLTDRSRGMGARIQQGGASSAALLRAGLTRSGDGLKSAGRGLKTAGGAVVTRTRGATQASASLSRTLVGKARAGFLAVETFTVETAVPRTAGTLKKAATRSWSFTSQTAAPWIARAFRATRGRLRPSALNADYRRLLLLLHDRVLDRDVESVLFVRAASAGSAQPPADAMRATPAYVFNWAMSAIPEACDRLTFVDLGAGRGRTMLLATGHNFEKVIGIEHVEELHDDCQMNLAQYPRSRMKCRDVECVHGDLVSAPLPEHETVYYLFQPFDERTLRIVVERIAAAYQRNPCRLYFVCVGMKDVAPLAANEVFLRMPLSRRLRLKLAALSPYPVAVYRSIA